jgi:hypothetical protein
MRTEGRTDITKLTVAFRSFAKAPNKDKTQLMTINNFKNASLLLSIYGVFFLSTRQSRRLCVRERQHSPGHHVTTALLRTATKKRL